MADDTETTELLRKLADEIRKSGSSFSNLAYSLEKLMKQDAASAQRENASFLKRLQQTFSSQGSSRYTKGVENQINDTVTSFGVLGRSADGGGPELQFLRLDDTRGLRRVAYRLRDGRLEWLRWNGRDAIGEPTVEPLLDKVRNVTWSFLYNNGRVAAWPPADGRVALPDGLVLELELPDQGVITRVISLR